MAGLYVHIPFCSSRCAYCGFFSTTCLSERQRYVDALCREMEMSHGLSWFEEDENGSFARPRFDTIYLGGGTPSQLSPAQLSQLFDALYDIYNVSEDAEVTMECNPDDITVDYAAIISQLPVNRVSMGAQTFDDGQLRLLHRRHTSRQVAQALGHLRQAGIANISIDLMYGFPSQSIGEWHRDIDAALELQVEHLSAYALTYEEGTPLYKMLQEGKVVDVGEELSRQMYYDLKARLGAAGYEHYELSNFARMRGGGVDATSPFRSRHNSGYWNHTPYLGLGASAHSYSGRRRQWNVADLHAYMEGVERGELQTECEELDEESFYNDTVMTALRTREGLCLRRLSEDRRRYCLVQGERYLQCGWLRYDAITDSLCLTRDGLFVSDQVIAALFAE